jgi:hypothetical protein
MFEPVVRTSFELERLHSSSYRGIIVAVVGWNGTILWRRHCRSTSCPVDHPPTGSYQGRRRRRIAISNVTMVSTSTSLAHELTNHEGVGYGFCASKIFGGSEDHKIFGSLNFVWRLFVRTVRGNGRQLEVNPCRSLITMITQLPYETCRNHHHRRS